MKTHKFSKCGFAYIVFLAALLLAFSPHIKAQWPRDFKSPQDGVGNPYCLLRIPAPFMGNANCFQFFVCSARAANLCTAAFDGVRWGTCQVSDLGLRSGFQLDPNAHPPGATTPFLNFEGADNFLKALSPYAGDWYGCFGPPGITVLPPRVPPVQPAGGPAGHCILRKPEPYQPNNEDPPICYEFYKAYTRAGSDNRKIVPRATIVNGLCFVTDIAAREGWQVDPFFGGPYLGDSAWYDSEIAMKRLSKYADDFYGCLGAETPPVITNGGGGKVKPDQLEDCDQLIKHFDNECKSVHDDSVKAYCAKHSYSGCALDAVGCFTPYWPSWLFKGKACSDASIQRCVKTSYESLISCLRGCSAQAVASGSEAGHRCVKGCGEAIKSQLANCEKPAR